MSTDEQEIYLKTLRRQPQIELTLIVYKQRLLCSVFDVNYGRLGAYKTNKQHVDVQISQQNGQNFWRFRYLLANICMQNFLPFLAD